MAEILISLTIIGIIAAITLPALQANINEKTWATQRKALYSRMSQAIGMLPSLNSYGLDPDQNVTNQKAAMTFITDGLKNVLKINNICDSTNLSKCGIPNSFTTFANSKMNFPTNLTELNPMFTSTYVTGAGSSLSNPQNAINTVAAAFETANGEGVVVFYNPLCQSDLKEFDHIFVQPFMCVNFVYDFNGKSGPNKVGKDIGFITALYHKDSEIEIVAPMPLVKDASGGTTVAQADAAAACKSQDSNSRVPNIAELEAMFYNRELLGIPSGQFWSSTILTDKYAFRQTFEHGRRSLFRRVNKYRVRCIKR